MTPEPFVMNDPWWIVAIKAIGIVLLVLTWQIINVWFERRVLGKMQQRKGPIMNGPFGLGHDAVRVELPPQAQADAAAVHIGLAHVHHGLELGPGALGVGEGAQEVAHQTIRPGGALHQQSLRGQHHAAGQRVQAMDAEV